MELIWSVMVLVPATGNEKDPLHPSSPLTRTHTADASESPSFPQRAHSTTPGKKDKSSDTNWRENKHSAVWGSLNPVFKQMNFTSTRLEMRTRFLSGTISPSREHMATMCWHWSSNTTLWIPAEVKTQIAFPRPAKYALIHITAGKKKNNKGIDKREKMTVKVTCEEFLEVWLDDSGVGCLTEDLQQIIVSDEIEAWKSRALLLRDTHKKKEIRIHLMLRPDVLFLQVMHIRVPPRTRSVTFGSAATDRGWWPENFWCLPLSSVKQLCCLF